MSPDTSCTIRVIRPVRLRGGRSVAVGTYRAERYSGGFSVAHPSGIEGARAFVPSAHAEEVELLIDRHLTAGGFYVYRLCTATGEALSPWSPDRAKAENARAEVIA